ncbi:MAG: N-6 DNA methylase [bacterium]
MIKKTKITDFLKKHEPDVLEKHLFYFFVIKNKLKISKSPILTEYFSNFDKNIILLNELIFLGINSLNDLKNCLELLITKETEHINGEFSVPDYIIEYMIEKTAPKLTDCNLDPSCGSGAFLLGLTEYYKTKFDKKIKDIVKENIFGADVLGYNVNRTKILLVLYALKNKEILEEEDFNLYVRDSLQYDWNNQFDNILGNPPIVKYQDIDNENRSNLAQNYASISNGAFNLYFGFFELGYNLLKDTGKLVFLTPNYFTSLAGESLRKYLLTKSNVYKIIDFGHKKIFEAQIDTALTFVNKKNNNFIEYARLINNTPAEFLNNPDFSQNKYINLNSKKWRLLKADEQENIKKIENSGTPIGKLFDINIGISTLKDELFFVDGDNYKKGYYIKETPHGIFKIEKEITKPVYKISDIKDQEAVFGYNQRIIVPYLINNSSPVPIEESVFKKKYRFCYEYLLSIKDELEKRDKGKTKFEPFYVWGKTHGIIKFGEKIVTPVSSQKPLFILLDDKDAYFTNGYGIYFKDYEEEYGLFFDEVEPIAKVENIDVVQKILNSAVMLYYISKTSISLDDESTSYQKSFIESFTIPKLSSDEINTLRSLADKKLIDKFLIEKYKLNFAV